MCLATAWLLAPNQPSSANTGQSPPVMLAGMTLSEKAGGILVTAVAPGSAAARAGIEVGDIIFGASSKPIKSPEELAAIVEMNKGRPVLLQVRRGDDGVFIALSDSPSPQVSTRRTEDKTDSSTAVAAEEPATPAARQEIFIRKCMANQQGTYPVCYLKWLASEGNRPSQKKGSEQAVRATLTDKVPSSDEVIAAIVRKMNKADDIELADLKKTTASIDIQQCLGEAENDCGTMGNGAVTWRGNSFNNYANRGECIEDQQKICKDDLAEHREKIANFRYRSTKFVFTVLKTNNYEGTVISYVDAREKGTDDTEHNKVTLRLVGNIRTVVSAELVRN